jgi:phosphohistidine phosphatase SixA
MLMQPYRCRERTSPVIPMHSVSRRCLLLLALAVTQIAALLPAAVAQDDPWSLLRQPGHVVLMRHSDAPGSGGYGDPPGFRLDDCATQRNLSEEGRAHARRTGEAFRTHGVAFDRTLTSPWCRCKETALLALGREAEPFAPLSNLVGRHEHRDGQVKAVKAYLASLDGSTSVLLVTHGIVIAAMTGITPASGEMVIVKPGSNGEPAVLGRLKVD